MANDVIGTDFKVVSQEGTFDISMSRNHNEAIYEAFQQLVTKIDTSHQGLLYDPYFTHIGIGAKRSYGSFKIHAIVYRKDICIHHARFETADGVNISGKLLNSGSALYVVLIKDSKDAGKETFAGPKRIKFNCETYEFEISVPRLLLQQRSAGERYLEFYLIQADPREIPYTQGTDLNTMPQNAILSHKMNYNGLWESNVMFELRKPEDSIFIGNEYDSKNNKNVMSFSTDGLTKTSILGRGRGRGRGVSTTGVSSSSNRST